MSENDNNEGNLAPESTNPVPPAPPYEEPAATAPPPPPQTPYADAGVAGDLMNPSKDERNWGMFSHLSGLVVGLVASAIGMPMLGFLGPLIIYLVKKDESPFVADQAKEALNFYISVSIIALVLIVLSLTVILMILTIPLLFALGLGALILSIIAAIKSSNGELYRYPFTLRLIK